MKYLLDTCVISDFVKDIGNTFQKIKTLSPDEIAISSLTVMEIEYGLALSPEKTKSFANILREMIGSITIIPFDSSAAEKTALIRADLKKRGEPIGAYDYLIGATALHHNLILVTSNTKEFQRINGLNFEDWR